MEFLLEIAKHFAKVMDSLISFIAVSIICSAMVLGVIWLKNYISQRYLKQGN